MISLYSELETLENITTFDNDFKEWNNLVKNGIEIYLNVDENTLSAKLNDPDDFLTLALIAYGGMRLPKASEMYFDKINKDFSLVLENPFSFYILDISEDKSKKLRDELGVSVFSSKNIPSNFHKLSIDEDFEENEIIQCSNGELCGWEKILYPFKGNYSNSTVIIDRNIFTNEERGENIGLGNLLQFLNNTLPENLNINYNITIVTDISNKTNRKIPRDILVTKIVDSINNLRNYQIDTEILFIHPSRPIYPYTHQRRILKNYHYAYSEHGFAIFLLSNNKKVRIDNTYKMYHNLETLIDNNQFGGIKLVKKLIKRLKEIKSDADKKLQELGQDDYHYYLYSNNNETTEIKNRLLN